MKTLTKLLFAFPIILLLACETSVREKPLNEYYDVEALIDRQTELLAERQSKVQKSIEVDGKKEHDTLAFDSLGWINELEVFKLADINKPTLTGAYNATEEQTQDGKIWKYITEKPSLGIEYLYIFFDKDSAISKLEARYHENNALYLSERNFEIKFDNSDDLSVLESYKIYGKQKMILKDEVVFSIESEVIN